MFSISDNIKITGKTITMGENGDREEELIPIGTTCVITDVEDNWYYVKPIDKGYLLGYWYPENALENDNDYIS